MAISGKEEYRELTDNGLAEAAGLISRREYNLSIVRSRQTAELLVKSYAAEKGIAYTTLADTIESLYAQGIISRNSRDAFHNIRIYGNKAVHDGDNDPENAQKAYYLLKSEVSTFLSRKSVNVDRTPVRVQPGGGSRQLNELEVEIAHDPDNTAGRRKLNESRQDAAGQSVSEQHGYYDGKDEDSAGNARRRISREGSERRDSRDLDRRRDGGDMDRRRTDNTDRRRDAHGERGRDRDRNRDGRRQQQGRRGGSAGGLRDNRAPRKEAARSSVSIYDLLRILLPIAVIILLIVIIRSFMAAKQPEETVAETTTVIETTIQETEPEPETEPETTEPETTAAPVEYRVKSDGVNVRYADNQNRIYTQLSKGTAIGTVTEIEGSDFVSFTLDGVNVVVRKDLIEPIQ